jgi:hypothetical protein
MFSRNDVAHFRPSLGGTAEPSLRGTKQSSENTYRHCEEFRGRHCEARSNLQKLHGRSNPGRLPRKHFSSFQFKASHGSECFPAMTFHTSDRHWEALQSRHCEARSNLRKLHGRVMQGDCHQNILSSFQFKASHGSECFLAMTLHTAEPSLRGTKQSS